MLRYRRVIVFLCFVATGAVGACAQVLSYSTYLPNQWWRSMRALFLALSAGVLLRRTH
jgi:hypothetical protein